MLNGSKIYPPKHYSDSFNFEIGINRLSNGSDLWIVRTPLTTATQLSGTSVKLRIGANADIIPNLYPSDYLHTGSDIYIISDDGGSRSLTIRQCIRSDRHLLKNHAIFTDNRPLRNKNSK